MQLTKFRITGVSPLLQNNPAKMQATKADSVTTKKKYDPAEQAEAAVYKNDDGSIYIPAIAFRSALLKACTARKIGKLSAATVIQASVFPTEERCPLIDAKGKPIKKYEIHSCRVVVMRAGVIRCRPLIANWHVDLAFDIDTEMLPNPEIIETLLNVAGKVAGVGDWRPEKKGIYGRFTAKLVA